ncbi:MAG: response regulator [Bryobacteraceae bacterium]
MSAHVLVVEDAAPDVYLIREALKRAQLDVQLTVFDDGEKAVTFIDELDRGAGVCPNIVLLDLNLPKRSGEMILDRIRHSGRCGQIPVVIVTSSDSPKDKAETARLGATEYFHKPSHLSEFMELGKVVRRHLDSEHEIGADQPV